MTARIGPVTRHGKWQVAPVLVQSVTPKALPGAVLASGHKTPVGMVFHDGQRCWAVTLEGAPLDLEGIPGLEGQDPAEVFGE